MKLVSIAEPQLIFYKDNVSARAMKLVSIAEPQLILYKDSANSVKDKIYFSIFFYK